MSHFIGGPLDGKMIADGEASVGRFVEGPWPGRYELVRTARVAGEVVLFSLAYQYDADYVRTLEPEIIWTSAE